MIVRVAAAMLVLLSASGLGCSMRNPSWATSINPCCGQDLIVQGSDPPEDRCADIVVDQDTARRLIADLSAGGAIKHWHVRFIPGGPACIWEEWPGLSDEDFLNVEPPETHDEDGGSAEGDTAQAASPKDPR